MLLLLALLRLIWDLARLTTSLCVWTDAVSVNLLYIIYDDSDALLLLQNVPDYKATLILSQKKVYLKTTILFDTKEGWPQIDPTFRIEGR